MHPTYCQRSPERLLALDTDSPSNSDQTMTTRGTGSGRRHNSPSVREAPSGTWPVMIQRRERPRRDLTLYDRARHGLSGRNRRRFLLKILPEDMVFVSDWGSTFDA